LLAAGTFCWQRKVHAKSPAEDAPYTARLTRTFDRVSSVGTPVTGTSTIVLARDRQGRLYENNSEHGTFFVQDPAKRQTLTWNSESREAVLGQWPYWEGRKGCWADGQGQHEAFFPRDDDWYNGPASPGDAKVETIDQHSKRRVVIENLGDKEIHGLTAHGTRMTTTPLEDAGTYDNQGSTSEIWKSREPNLKVLEVQTFSKSGWERKELSDLQRGDPDPALFQPPQGYKIQTIEYHQVPCEH
jgi:hypothetical protein